MQPMCACVVGGGKGGLALETFKYLEVVFGDVGR